MTAVLVPAATGAEWLEARRQGITASEIPIVMGLSPWSSPYALYHQKTGTLPPQDDNDAMALGRYLEAFVASRFADLYPEFTVTGDGRTLYAHPDRDWQLATPDRLVDCCPAGHPDVGPPLAVLECKTAASYDDWGDDGTDEIPVHYRCQVLWQMDVLGVQTGFVACLFLHSRKLRVYELTMDDAAQRDLTLMRIEALRFLDRLRGCGPPPDIDWRPATTAALKRLHPDMDDLVMSVPHQLATRYQAAVRNLKAAEQRKARYENQIRDILGSCRYAHDGRTGDRIARRDVYDLPEKTITRKATTVDRLVPVKPKEQ